MTASPASGLTPGARVHLVGIGGTGMSAIAQVLLARGHAVSGSDLRESDATRRLRAAGATVHIGHAAAYLAGAEVVVVSRAVPEDNVEIRAATERGLPIVHRARLLAHLMEGRHAIAVAGTHGKTTTTAMIAAILERAGRDPTALVGGEVASLGGTARVGAGPDVVAEVDESDGSLLWIAPHVAVITPLDATDHLDYYGSEGRLMDTFRRFLEGLPASGFAVVCTDAAAGRALAAGAGRRTVTYGLAPGAAYTAQVLEAEGRRTVFEAHRGGAVIARIVLAIPGVYNALNALGALAVATELGVPPDVAAASLAAFDGVARRFSVRGDVDGILVVDDYAHNPTKVAALLAAARRGWPRSRIVAVFQPHRFSRTQTVGAQFAHAFDAADEVVVTEIYAADEPPIPGVDAGIIVRAASAHRLVRFVPELADAAALLAAEARPGDLILTIGAGDVWKVADDVVARLARRGGPGGVGAARHAEAGSG
ncbi:MAG TPA: UDP-N-acetylmuramate--L-alanine ligase [bacterium]|nr:UDP-N-acetylmuramate--L-alanine ligase [bacterium]